MKLNTVVFTRALQLSRTLLAKSFSAACAALLAGLAPAAFGQSITNPSFEADTFTVSPGTITSNSPITGWTVSNPARAGLARVGGLNAFVDNGTIPNGTNVLFLQTTNVASTVISGLTPAVEYTVRFRVNSPVSGGAPTLRVAIDNNPSLFDAGSVTPVAAAGQPGPWKFVSFNFTATSASHTLNITNNSPTLANTLLLDDFSISVSSGKWSSAQWSNDATSGIDNTKRYTHAFAFGTAGATFTLNGVTFTRLLVTGNPTLRYEFTGSLGSTTVENANGNVPRSSGGGSAILANQFAFNGNPEVFAFHNLIPGQEYVATWYTVGWDAAGKTYGRSVTFSAGDEKFSVNQDHFGENQGIRISYRYAAPASGFMVISNIPLSLANGSLHTYGASNYEVTSTNEPAIGVQPVSKASLTNSGASFYVTATGARPLGFQWYKDGGVMANQTNRVLLLTNLTATDLAQYSVVVSNSFGTATSSSAGLTFSTATFANPSFDGSDPFMTWPGYAADNFPIPGWFASRLSAVGQNIQGALSSPFVNNGASIGANSAFIQNTVGASNGLSTIIQNLTPGQLYTLNFAVNARAAAPNLHIAIDGQSISDIRVSSVGGAGFGATGLGNPYRRVAFDFTASNSSVFLSLTNDQQADTTVILDDFSIAPSTTKWSYVAWTNDASSGVDPSKFYTHAFNFGATADTVVNGVIFRGTAGPNPTTPGHYSTAGFGTTFLNDVNVLTPNGDGSSILARDFLYGGPVQTITLTNLVPGTQYVATVYGVGFDSRVTGRSATFSVGSDLQTINLDHFGNDIGNRISYNYVADASGSITLTYTPNDAGYTFHTYGFANYQVVGGPPVIAAQPVSQFVDIGQIVTLAVPLSAGAQPTFYYWQLEGTDIADQTNSTLVLSNLTAGLIGNYRVIVSNSFGAVTSQVAVVEWGLRISELFNTGVDETNQFLSGGQVDSHYRLASNPDPFFPGPDAFVMHNGAYPLAGNYFTNGLFSSWISPRTNSSIGNSNGFYVYRTSFIVDTVDPTHAQINGKWASDNEGIDILLNGTSLGISNMVSAAFGGFTPFTITNGFILGSNVIDFVISNGPAPGPTALRTELSGTGRPLPPARPQIINEPVGGTVLKNSSVALSVLAIGSGPLSYQWFFEGSPIADGTNRVLRFPSIQFAQAGNYSVTITNDQGPTNSVTVNLEVIEPPRVLVGPDNVVITCSDEATFFVEYNGTPPITFQWYFRGNPMAGETGDFVLVPNVHPAQTGPYFVVLTGPGGSYTSSVATLTLLDSVRPVISSATNLVVCTGSNSLPVSFTVTATDDCDPSPSVVCTPASGSVFPLGTNTVTCVATDANGNAATNTFTVTVFKAAQPTATNVNRSGTTVTFGFQTENGCTYRVEKTDSLSPPSWIFLQNIVGDGTVKAATDPDATVPMRFYRIVVQ